MIKYKGYGIHETYDENMPYGGIYVEEGDFKYLSVSGIIENNAGNGWFNSIQHAKDVIDKTLTLIKCGGE